MNIFETIKRAGVLNERCHSQFLADALNESVSPDGDRSLFDSFWALIAPCDWDAPSSPEIFSEETVDEDGRRIDIVIHSSAENDQIIGIEVKTTDSSVREGQLCEYREGLAEKYPDSDLAMAFLTPFNGERAGDQADFLNAVIEFDVFSRDFDRARHVSWLDVADITWDDNPLWEQHRNYVRNHISSEEILKEKVSERQTLEKFLDSCEDPKVREAVSRLFDVATSEGAKLWIPPRTYGLRIRVKCSQISHPVIVAWIYPPNNPGTGQFRNFRDFTFGVFTNTRDSSHPSLRPILEEWTNTWRCNGEFQTQSVANNQGIEAHSISYDDLIEHIDFIEDRLKEVISEINSL